MFLSLRISVVLLFLCEQLYLHARYGVCSTADSRLAEYEDIEGPTLEAGTSGLAERLRLIIHRARPRGESFRPTHRTALTPAYRTHGTRLPRERHRGLHDLRNRGLRYNLRDPTCIQLDYVLVAPALMPQALPPIPEPTPGGGLTGRLGPLSGEVTEFEVRTECVLWVLVASWSGLTPHGNRTALGG
jgi:hypothetical protein